MSVNQLSEVCRLCLQKDNLVWVFEKKQNYEPFQNMQQIISTTTGVQILPKDVISQKICTKCCEIVMRMYQFRSQSLENDHKLREQWKEYLKLSNILVKSNMALKPENAIDMKNEIKQEPDKTEIVIKPKEIKQEQSQAHPTVTRLFEMYPQIKLPRMVIRSNISPCVTMDMDEVEMYFKKRNINMQKHISFALKSYKQSLIKELEKHSANTKKSSHSQDDKKTENISRNGIVAPINIKLNSSNADFSIVDVNKIINPNLITLKSSTDSRGSTSKSVDASPKKRRLSVTDSPIPEKKQSLIETLGLTPKFKSNDIVSLEVDKQVPLLICDICNSIHYHAKDLKRHRLKHLRCQFCKTRFKNLDLKNEHIEKSCIIKLTMSNLPDVELRKIEFDLNARKKYPSAFLDFPPIPNLESAPPLPKDAPKTTKSSVDVIEILSDDEATEKNKSKLAATSPKVSPVQSSLTGQTVTTISKNVSSSIVKPDVKVKGLKLDIFDSKLTDLQVLKELLLNVKHFNFSTEKLTQTELPKPEAVNSNPQDYTTDLKKLKYVLNVFKLPVDILKGNVFEAKYNYNKQAKKDRKLFAWNDLIPIDVKTPVLMKVSPPVNSSKYKDNLNNNNNNNNTVKCINVTLPTQPDSNTSTSTVTTQSSTDNRVLNAELSRTSTLRQARISQNRSPPKNVTTASSAKTSNLYLQTLSAVPTYNLSLTQNTTPYSLTNSTMSFSLQPQTTNVATSQTTSVVTSPNNNLPLNTVKCTIMNNPLLSNFLNSTISAPAPTVIQTSNVQVRPSVGFSSTNPITSTLSFPTSAYTTSPIRQTIPLTNQLSQIAIGNNVLPTFATVPQTIPLQISSPTNPVSVLKTVPSTNTYTGSISTNSVMKTITLPINNSTSTSTIVHTNTVISTNANASTAVYRNTMVSTNTGASTIGYPSTVVSPNTGPSPTAYSGTVISNAGASAIGYPSTAISPNTGPSPTAYSGTVISNAGASVIGYPSTVVSPNTGPASIAYSGTMSSSPGMSAVAYPSNSAATYAGKPNSPIANRPTISPPNQNSASSSSRPSSVSPPSVTVPGWTPLRPVMGSIRVKTVRELQ